MAKDHRSTLLLENKSLPGFNAHRLWYFIPGIALGLGAVALNLTGIAPNLVGWGQYAQGVIWNSENILSSVAGLTGLGLEVAAVPILGAVTYKGIRLANKHVKYNNMKDAIVDTETAENATVYELQLADTRSLINSVLVSKTKDSALVRYLNLADTRGKKHISFAKKEKMLYEEDYIKLVISKLCDRLHELCLLKHRDWNTAIDELKENEIVACKEEMLAIQTFFRQVINKREAVEPFGKVIMHKMKKYRTDVFDAKTFCGLELLPDDDGNATRFNRLLTGKKYKEAFYEAFKLSAPHLSDEKTTATPEQKDHLIDDEVEKFLAYIGSKKTEVKKNADGTIVAMTEDKTRVTTHADGTIDVITSEGERVKGKADDTITFINDEGNRVTITVNDIITTLNDKANETNIKMENSAKDVENKGTSAKIRIKGAVKTVEDEGEDARLNIGKTRKSAIQSMTDVAKHTKKVGKTLRDEMSEEALDVKETGRRSRQSMTDVREATKRFGKTARNEMASEVGDTRTAGRTARTNIDTEVSNTRTAGEAGRKVIEDEITLTKGSTKSSRAKVNRIAGASVAEIISTKNTTAEKIGRAGTEAENEIGLKKETTLDSMRTAKQEVEDVARVTEKGMLTQLNEVDMTREFTEKAMLRLLNEVDAEKQTFERDLNEANKVLGRITKEHVSLKIDIVNKWYSKVLNQISKYSPEDVEDFITFFKNFHIISDTVVDLASRVGAITAVLNDTTIRAQLTDQKIKGIIAVIQEFDKAIDTFNGGLEHLDARKVNVPQLSDQLDFLTDALYVVGKKLAGKEELLYEVMVDVERIKADKAQARTITSNPEKTAFNNKVKKLKLYARAIAYYSKNEPNNPIVLPTKKGTRTDKGILRDEIGDSSIQFSDKVLTYTPDKPLGKTFVDFMVKQGQLDAKTNLNLDTLKFEDADLVDELLARVLVAVELYNSDLRRSKNATEFNKLTEI